MQEKMGFEGKTEQAQVRLGELLWDVHAAGMKIVEFTAQRDFEEFAGNELLRSVVGSMLGIIGTALGEMRNQFPEEFARISNGNKLIEAGSIVDAEKLWRVVEELVPELVGEARAVLEDWHQA